MTLSEFRQELWEAVGEPPQLDPATAYGKERLDRWINKAYKKVLFWRFPDGTQLRFPCLEGELFFQTVVVTGLVVAATTTTVTLDSAAGVGASQYEGWVLDAGSGIRQVIAYDGPGRVATLHEATGTAAVVGATYTLFKRFMRLCESGDVGANENIVCSPVDSIMEIAKITDVSRFIDLAPARRDDGFPLTAWQQGIPRQYRRQRNDIVFDYPVNGTWTYRMEYVRMPADLVEDTDVPEIPTYWDDAILTWAEYRADVFLQDSSLAYARKRDLMDFMTMTKTQSEMQYERESGQAEVDLR